MIDRKFKFVATNPCKGTVYTEDNALVLCAKDKAVIPALEAYKVECRRLGAGNEHVESIGLLIDRVREYQKYKAGGGRIPDTETDCEIDRCIGGNV